ncbi:hypothetical protein [Polyangium sp. 6x1]|uniref:hypothetical protein n=1 Tax=Polyangium sp. 6x1 TaxID=3042689 RepID=UPI0024825A57|nr:hypothetical protein [Polyangium sp. 6x1]MDI1450760.1 hypothetical protein [Polyangium sp. 6x1]
MGLLLGFASLTSATAASARPFRVNDIPNGSKYGCLNCHGDTKASYNTDFGSDARLHLVGAVPVQQQNVDWGPLCPLDSDQDGWTNGQELGDPNCTWTKGDADPKGFVYNPGNFDLHPPPVCGSGKLEAGEACDGKLFLVSDCEEAGAGEGTLACTKDCKLDYSKCSEPPGSMPDFGGDGTAAQPANCAAAPGSTGSLDGMGAVIGLVVAAAVMRRRRR